MIVCSVVYSSPYKLWKLTAVCASKKGDFMTSRSLFYISSLDCWSQCRRMGIYWYDAVISISVQESHLQQWCNVLLFSFYLFMKKNVFVEFVAGMNYWLQLIFFLPNAYFLLFVCDLFFGNRMIKLHWILLATDTKHMWLSISLT